MKSKIMFLIALGVTLTTPGAEFSLAGTGDLFEGWDRFTTNSPPTVVLINTQDTSELREQVKQAGGGTRILRRKIGPDNSAMPHGLKKVLLLRDRIEELSGIACLLVHYTQITRRDLEKPNIKAIVFTAWKPREDKFHEQEMAELVKLTSKPFIGFCGGHHFVYLTYGGKSGVIRKLQPGERDPAPKYYPGYYKEWDFMPVRVVKRDPLFDGLPDEIIVPQRHYAECKQLPPEFELLASSAECKVQAIKHRQRPVYSTQFHPEMYDDEHSHGKLLLQNFFRLAGINRRRAATDLSPGDNLPPAPAASGYAMNSDFFLLGSDSNAAR